MSLDARILVVTEVVDDAELVKKLLRDEFDGIATSTDPERTVQDFEKHKPAVLILAFNTLEKAERYYLGLYRLSTLVHALPHRTLILCDKDDLQRVYALCKKEYFDDYILFWPMTHDAPRLPMAVHHALRQMANAAAGIPGAGEIAAQARRIVGLEAMLEQGIANGGERIDFLSRSLEQAGKRIDSALDGFSRRLSEADPDLLEIKDRARFDQEIARLKDDEIEKHFQSVAAAVNPASQWAGAFKSELLPKLEAVRALQALAARVRPVLLVVDDDPFQRKLMARMLADADIDSIFAGSGTEALATLRRHRPDLILMDVNLPDIDGVEATRRIKSVEALANIPVIMITGQSEKEVVVQSLKVGAVDFVVKPFNKDILLAKVRKFLEGDASS